MREWNKITSVFLNFNKEQFHQAFFQMRHVFVEIVYNSTRAHKECSFEHGCAQVYGYGYAIYCVVDGLHIATKA